MHIKCYEKFYFILSSTEEGIVNEVLFGHCFRRINTFYNSAIFKNMYKMFLCLRVCLSVGGRNLTFEMSMKLCTGLNKKNFVCDCDT